MTTSKYTSETITRFTSKIASGDSINECWNWTACRNPKGYGVFSMGRNKSNALAHRIAYTLAYGEIPDGLLVCHKCDNRSCCNPNHLFLGTSLDNSQDMTQKQRQAKSDKLGNRNGEHNSFHVLTYEQVARIRELFAMGNITKAELGRMFGTSRTNVYDIVTMKSWRV